ncbi:hypothetical protein GOBAR_DD34422 [Gossypium barbadense]|nr:hypothetical protein GOBAR_DD34422 [Gossypium barbadense]
MKTFNLGWLLFAAVLLISALPFSQASRSKQHKVKTGVFRSPQFVLGPGSVANKLFSNIDFPRGHIALKSFDAEVVDESGNPIPLYDTYLHHWLVLKFYIRKGLENQDISKLNNSDYISGRNSGICQDGALDQFFGLGSETRRTKTRIPDPYGIEIGNPTKIPSGFVETWGLNVHAIDTRGVEDRTGCTECRCNLYNVTKEEDGTPLSPNYDGGLSCCYDGTKFNIYIFDVSDTWKKSRNSTEINSEHNCQVEYQVESCRATGSANDKCIDAKSVSLEMPFGGYLVYGGAHQHAGGTGSALYGKDGRSLCSSIPIYGTGEEAGNENGYIVGMSTCYPKPGTKKISKGETLILESNYSSIKQHTGVMGLFYILVAETLA